MFNQMFVRMAAVSTELAEAPRVPARNLVIHCRQWLDRDVRPGWCHVVGRGDLSG